MKKQTILILSVAFSLGLAGCGGANSSSQAGSLSASSSDSDIGGDSSSSSSVSHSDLDATMTLSLIGELYPNSERSIYATVPGFEKEPIVFESSNPEIVSVSNLYEDELQEGYLYVKGVGSVVISAHLKNYPNVKAEKTVEVKTGSAMSETLFSNFKGGMRVDGKAQYLDYGLGVEGTLDSSETFITIYEEKDGAPSSTNKTDCYEIKVVDDATGKTALSKQYVKSTGSYVGTEYLDYTNSLGAKTIYNDDDEAMKFNSSYYSNNGFPIRWTMQRSSLAFPASSSAASDPWATGPGI